MATKVLNGLTRMVGSEVRRLSSVPDGLWGGGTNQEVGGSLITRGISGVGGMGGEVHSETGVGNWEVGTLERWTLAEPGWLENASGCTGS